MSKISVIVPVYNVAQYIERCAVSLFEQTLGDIEYLFIDDCSTDNSVEILQSVMERYPDRRGCVHIFRMRINGGTSLVRAVGLKEAKGDYVIHCDSDDWVEKDYYEKLYCKAVESNADIVVADFIRESATAVTKVETEVYETPRKMLENVHNKSFYCMLWNKLMRRSLLVDNNVTLVSGINMWEDVLVTLQAFYFAKNITKVEGTYYHYWINPASYTAGGANEKSYEQRKMCVAELEKFFADKGDWSLQLNYWKMLAKMFMLQPGSFDVRRWRNEYPEAVVNIDKMGAFTPAEKRKMKLAANSLLIFFIYTLPVRIVCRMKKIIKSCSRK